MNIRLATAADIPAMLCLERQSVTAGHWSEEHYERMFQPGPSAISQRLALVVDKGMNAPGPSGSAPAPILGFAVARAVFAPQADPEWELENIVVAPAACRKGLGGELLAELLRRAQQTNSESVFLEVRESNTVARAFYQKWGFQEMGRRKGYYENPHEDAILYRRKLP